MGIVKRVDAWRRNSLADCKEEDNAWKVVGVAPRFFLGLCVVLKEKLMLW